MTKRRKKKERRSKGLHARWKKIWYGILFRTFFYFTKATKLNSLRKFLLLQYSEFNGSHFGCHPTQSTEWLGWVAMTCELRSMRTAPFSVCSQCIRLQLIRWMQKSVAIVPCNSWHSVWKCSRRSSRAIFSSRSTSWQFLDVCKYCQRQHTVMPTLLLSDASGRITQKKNVKRREEMAGAKGT